MIRTSCSSMLAALTLLGCGKYVGPQDVFDASAVDGATVADAAVDVSSVCQEGTHDVGDGVCDSTLIWAESAFASARDHHATFVVETSGGAFLYVAGGASNAHLSGARGDVVFARIENDGSLGDWMEGPSLPGNLVAPGVAVSHNKVFLTGGLSTISSTELVIAVNTRVADIHDDGTLSSWYEGPELVHPSFHHQTLAVGEYLYTFGTYDRTTSGAQTQRARFTEDGSLGPWEDARPLPVPRSHYAIAFHDGVVYLVGGVRWLSRVTADPDANRDVIRASIQEDGSIGEWTTAGTLALPTDTGAAVVHGNELYVIAGNQQGNVLDQVIRAPILPTGDLGEWESSTSLGAARHHMHQSPLYRHHVYAVSGYGETSADVPFVDIGQFE